MYCEKGTGFGSETVSEAASSASFDRNRRHSRDSCVWSGLDLDPRMRLGVDDDPSLHHLCIARQIAVDHRGLCCLRDPHLRGLRCLRDPHLRGLRCLRDPHLCAVSLLEVPDKVIEIGTEIGVTR